MAYAVDLAKRIENRSLIDGAAEEIEDLEGDAAGLLTRAAKLYPAVEQYQPAPDGPPALSAIQTEIERRAEMIEEEEEEDEEDEEE